MHTRTPRATQVLEMDQRERLKIAAAAQRRAATMFSTEGFQRGFLQAMAPVMCCKGG
jgi:hypothetical protein